MNYTDPSGHGIWSKIKSAAKKVTTTVKNTYNKAKTWVKNTYNKAKNWVSNTYQNAKKALTNVVYSSGSSEKNKSGKSSSGGRYSSGGSNAGNRKYSSSSRGSGKSNFYRPSTYEWAKGFGQSRYNWFSSKMKESGNIRNSWTKAIEKTVRKFCTTASRIKKDAVRSVKAANIAIGISAITIGKMKLEQLKKKLPNINISIDYTGTWKDSLQLGLGIVTTGGGLLLTLVGGGSEIASVGSSSAISIPVATEGIAIAGTGLAISGSTLANMFDVRIQKSESNKGNGSGKSAGERGKENVPDKAKEIARQVKENNGAQPKGYKNIPLEEGAQKLPEGVNYREYDINPYVKGQNRGPERIVIGDDNSVWYTNDHYYTFTRIE
ncbi:ribonuclease domain-containing protein [[Ruminococcus] lactaris]|uniref:ribonuclease domain-containing protein n=2 Tax=[Ruminococcus] lactaris TaxID=46228 RepID=UPI002676500D|nr:ribonuclease domain-containing protein [[Ruminococcus] lactaris]